VIEYLPEIHCFGGGVDSVVSALMLASEATEPIYLMHVNYGQIAAAKEREALTALVTAYPLLRPVLVEAPFIAVNQDASLFRGCSSENHVVEGRNFYLATIAARYSNIIWFGFSHEENTQVPDSTDEWCEDCETVLKHMLGRPVVVRTLLRDIPREELLEIGYSIDAVTMKKVHTCWYDTQGPECECVHCKWYFKHVKKWGLG
jgi:7-cyano-7-deazaguanine synthase in queuosine biosynthesis